MTGLSVSELLMVNTTMSQSTNERAELMLCSFTPLINPEEIHQKHQHLTGRSLCSNRTNDSLIVCWGQASM